MVNGKIDPEFAVNYFKQKNIHHIATFACWEESGKKKLNLFSFNFIINNLYSFEKIFLNTVNI